MQIDVAQHMVNSSTAKRTIVIRGGAAFGTEECNEMILHFQLH